MTMIDQDALKREWQDKNAIRHYDLVAATKKVPETVRKGSFQTAKKWKELARKVASDKFPGGKPGLDVDELRALYQTKQYQIEQLTGERPL